MSFNTALTSGQLESLRGTASISPSHHARLFLSTCPNTNVLTGRVNQSEFASSFASVVYDTGSGDVDDVRVGMTVLISHTNDRKAAYWAGRVRAVPDGITIYINETSAPIEDNDYIFIIDDYRIWDKLGRYSGGVIYPDYEVTFRQLLPRIYNLQAAYLTMTDGADGEFDFAPGVAATTSGATISSYLWDVGDGTITAGSTTTKDITATFPPGFRWVHFSATDNGGRTSTRHFPVWVHDPDNMPTPLEIGDLEVSAAIEDGYSGTIGAFAGVSTMLDNTLVMAWIDRETYNGTATNIVDNIALIGRFRSGRDNTVFDETGQQDSNIRYEIEGPLQILTRLEMASIEILSDTTPTAFCEIDDCTPWRELFFILSEFSTFHELHSISLDDTTTTFADLGVVVPAGSLMNAVNSIAETINAHFQMNAAGEAELVRNGVMIDDADRGDLVTVANWTTADILGIEYDHDNVNIVGRILASGGSFNTTSRKVTVTNSIAPGVAQDYPEGTASLDRQVLTADLVKPDAAAELNIRTGHALARAQGGDELVILHPDGYWWLTPACNQWYTFTLAGEETVSGLVLTTSTRWQLVSISITHGLVEGAREVRATYRRETSGAPAQTIVYPPQSITPIQIPEFPPLPAWPVFDISDFFLPDDITDDISPPALAGSLSSLIRHDGNTVMVGSAAGLWLCGDFVSRLTPTWHDVTPPLDGGTIVDAYFTTDTNPPGAVVAVSGSAAAGGTWEYEIDFRTTPGGFATGPFGGSPSFYNYGTWQAGAGWLTQVKPGVNDDAAWLEARRLIQDFTITKVDLTYNGLRGPNFTGGDQLDVGFSGVTLDSQWQDGVNTVTYTFAPPVSFFEISIFANNVSGGVVIDGAKCFIQKIKLYGTGFNPFGGGAVYKTDNVFSTAPEWTVGSNIGVPVNMMRIGNTFDDIYLVNTTDNEVYYSDDRGVTFAAPVAIGTPAAAATGFDTQKTGDVTLGGAEDKVRIADTAGGSYIDYTTYPTDAYPTAIFIPRYKIGDGSNNGSGVDEPDYITSSAIADTAAGHSLWKVTTGGGSVTQIDTTDSGGSHGKAFGPNNLHMPWSSTGYQDILAILSYASGRKLSVSDDAGTTWVITAVLNDAADYPQTRKSDYAHKQLFAVNGQNCIYASDYHLDPIPLATRIGPSFSTLIFIKVLP